MENQAIPNAGARDDSPVVLRTRELTKHFTLAGRFRRQGRRRKGDGQHQYRGAPRQDSRPCGRERIGQVDTGQGHRAIAELQRAAPWNFRPATERAPVDLTKLDGKALQAVRRELAMIFQDPLSSLDPRMRVGQLLSEPMNIQFGNSLRSGVVVRIVPSNCWRRWVYGPATWTAFRMPSQAGNGSAFASLAH